MKAIGIKTIGNNYFSDIRVKTDFNNHTVEDYFDLGKPFIDKDLKLSNDLSLFNSESKTVTKAAFCRKIGFGYVTTSIILINTTSLKKALNYTS